MGGAKALPYVWALVLQYRLPPPIAAGVGSLGSQGLRTTLTQQPLVIVRIGFLRNIERDRYGENPGHGFLVRQRGSQGRAEDLRGSGEAGDLREDRPRLGLTRQQIRTG